MNILLDCWSELVAVAAVVVAVAAVVAAAAVVVKPWMTPRSVLYFGNSSTADGNKGTKQKS